MKINSAAANLRTANLKSLPGEIPQEEGFCHKIVDKFERAVRSVDEYTKPRFEPEKGIDTSGDRNNPSIFGATMAGAMSGLATQGLYGVPAGIAGAVVGTLVGKKGGLLGDVGAGALAGAATGAAVGAVVAGPAGAVSFAITGALTGAIGTLYGSGKANSRDGTFGSAFLGGAIFGPQEGLIAGVAGGIGGKAFDQTGRTVLGAVSGAVIGGAIGALGGPVGILVGAVKGALLGAGGTLLGPRLNQAVRNCGADINKWIDKHLAPHLKNVKVKKWQKIAMGALVMSIPMAFSLGRCFGAGMVVGAVAGGVMGAKAMAAILKQPSVEVNPRQVPANG
jgi:outer membrane lipoprotein SlyB